VARKSVIVSDFTGKEIKDPKWLATVTVKFSDLRRGIVVAEAHIEDEITKEIAKVGRQQARRGRRPKAASA
jgi:hypothetical protein